MTSKIGATNSEWWKCDCEEDNIHSRRYHQFCAKCGLHHDEGMDALQTELETNNLYQIYTRTEEAVPKRVWHIVLRYVAMKSATIRYFKMIDPSAVLFDDARKTDSFILQTRLSNESLLVFGVTQVKPYLGSLDAYNCGC